MIRPIDLQNTILQSMQGAAGSQRAEETPRQNAQAAQAAFVAHATQRDESIGATHEASGARIGDKPPSKEPHDGERKRRAASATTARFEEIVDDAAAGASDAPHLIDLTA